MQTTVKSLLSKILLPINEFIRFQESGGIILLFSTVLAIVLANSAWSEGFIHFWEIPAEISFAGYLIHFSPAHLINDGLMTIFFVVVGLEIKREVMEGELSTPQKALLPVIAALGGMLMPALFFTVFNFNHSTQNGWGIPTATDIAFSLTVISLLGNKIPNGLKVFLAALAIADDLGAVVIIALFYSASINWLALGIGLGIFGIMLLLNYRKIDHLLPYYVLGIVLWVCFLKSGIHPTIAGVLFAITIPHRRKKNFEPRVKEVIYTLEKHLDMLRSEACKQDKMLRDQVIEEMQRVSRIIESPLQNLLHYLHPFSGYIIMPLFALANAGIIFTAVSQDMLFHPLLLGIGAGLILGKSTGIIAFTWLSVKIGIAKLPVNVSFSKLYGLAWLAGIGFTMSIFIANLALPSEILSLAKMAILGASCISGITGYLILHWQSRLIPVS
jgi:NhaA family Na+:H+ antiporter